MATGGTGGGTAEGRTGGRQGGQEEGQQREEQEDGREDSRRDSRGKNRRTAGRTVGGTAERASGRRVGRTAGRTAGRRVGRTAGRTAGRRVGRTAGRTAGRRVGRTAGRTAGGQGQSWLDPRPFPRKNVRYQTNSELRKKKDCPVGVSKVSGRRPSMVPDKAQLQTSRQEEKLDKAGRTISVTLTDRRRREKSIRAGRSAGRLPMAQRHRNCGEHLASPAGCGDFCSSQ